MPVIYHTARCQRQSNVGKNKGMTMKKRLRHFTKSLTKINNVVLLLIACVICSEVATLKLEPKTQERFFHTFKVSLKWVRVQPATLFFVIV